MNQPFIVFFSKYLKTFKGVCLIPLTHAPGVRDGKNMISFCGRSWFTSQYLVYPLILYLFVMNLMDIFISNFVSIKAGKKKK